MNTTVLSPLEAALTCIVHASWQAAVLGVAVLVACRLLAKSLQPRWRFALWLVVFARLALPIVPTSPWSLFQLASFTQRAPTVEAPADGPLQDREMRPPADSPVQPIPNLSSPAVEAP